MRRTMRDRTIDRSHWLSRIAWAALGVAGASLAAASGWLWLEWEQPSPWQMIALAAVVALTVLAGVVLQQARDRADRCWLSALENAERETARIVHVRSNFERRLAATATQSCAQPRRRYADLPL